MQLVQALPILSLILVVIFALVYTAKDGEIGRVNWVWPAALSALFLAFSLYTVAQEGLFGFWPNHTQDLWGNQVWVDLLLAFAIGWTFLLPWAVKLGMSKWLWTAALLCSGCIGLLAMYARVLYLQESADRTA